ncbi:putative bifunctional diguanylate cyclase/phosphodiesterase [Oceanobacter mangrovi]|uniref:putative bifunctional diguanylate cyclase/phosphodiesterase n=1 Tax=Oceanobacter mangrovi TaxID=2862510 RepID=UPI001C8EF37E|nr:EAL domain-containing protein [Oceanobacter mangrovi]
MNYKKHVIISGAVIAILAAMLVWLQTGLATTTLTMATTAVAPLSLLIWLFYSVSARRQWRLNHARAELSSSEQARLQAEQRLKDHEQIQSMVDSHIHGFLIAGESGHILTCNPALGNMFGYQPDELIGQPLEILLPPHILPTHQGLFDGYIQAHPRPNLFATRPVKGRHRNGQLIDIELSLSPIKSSAGVEVAATVVDIAGRLEKEREIRTFATAFQEAGEAMLILNPQMQILHVNESFKRMTGLTDPDLPLLTCADFLENSHRSGHFSVQKNFFNEHSEWSGQHVAIHKDGSRFPIQLSVCTSTGPHNQVEHLIMSFIDISELEDANRQLEKLALHDCLTGLPNRVLLKRLVEAAINRCGRRQNRFALMFIDLDNFKYINDAFGHMAGDEVLIKVAELLQGSLRSDDTVARLGGDEFVVIVEGLEQDDAVLQVSHKIMKKLNVPFSIRGESVRVTASIGICVYPTDGHDYDTLLRNADASMYRAKDSGKAGFHFYKQGYDREYAELIKLDFELHQAIETDQLYLVYQPQYDLISEEVVGVEALVRWNHPERGKILPNVFLPIAEKMSLLPALEEWVFRHACQQARQWQDSGVNFRKMAVNVTGARLQKGSFHNEFSHILQDTGCDPLSIEIEITEDFIVQRSEQSLRELNGIRALGITIAIDDFGTGYSSLSYLKDLPIDKLKIDRSFIQDLHLDSGSQKIITALVALARGLDLRIIAEGVENPEQVRFLIGKGCNEVQGFLYSQPVEAHEIEAQLGYVHALH